MSEFTYDIKLYQIFEIHKEKALAYSLEIFSLNEPDYIYRYNYPLHKQSSNIHTPMHLGYDILNLIENPSRDLIGDDE